MAADGTVNIDVILNNQQALAKQKELDDALKNTGKGTGDKALESIKGNLNQAVKESKSAHDKMKDELGQPIKPKIEPETEEATNKIKKLGSLYVKIPKDVKTKLIAEAKDQGITNFDKLLRKIPKKTLTELVAKVERSEEIKYEEELRKIPAKIVTELKLNNKASLPLKQLQDEAKQTTHSFSRLHDVIAGTFVGSLAIQGIQGIKNGLIEAAKAGMQYNIEQDKMKTVWTALTTEAPRDGKQLVNFINDLSQHSIYAAETIDKMAQSFYHVHSSVKETKDWTNDFVRLGSTLHMTNDQLAEAGEQFSKIIAGGKANAEDMSVMINRFPMFGEALQKATGKSMAQLYEMSAKGKLTAKEFEEALDYLGKKYKNSTEEAMTSFTGMSMYIHSRWQVLWGQITNTAFKGNKKLSEDLRDLLSDKMIAKYADLIGQALGAVMNIVIAILSYVGNHKDTIVDIIGNLGKIIAIIGETVWDTFKGIIEGIASLFGLTSSNSKDAHGALEDFDDILQTIVDHKGAIKTFTAVLMAMFATKKIYDSIDALTSFYGILKDIVGIKGLSGVVKGIGVGAKGGELAEDAEATIANPTTRTAARKVVQKTGATRVGQVIGQVGSRILGLPQASKTMAKAGEEAASATTRMGAKAAVKAGERTIIRRAASRIPVVGSLIAGGTELIGINNKNKNEKIGRAVGATGGTAAGGATGALIGGAIGSIIPGAGTAVGAGVGSFVGSTVGGIFGAKGGGAIGKNIKKIKDSIVKPFKTLGSDVAKAIGNIAKPVEKAFSTLKSILGKLAKGIEIVALAPFVLLTAAIIKTWQKIEKPVTKAAQTISKMIQKAWNGLAKITSRVWNAISKTILNIVNKLSKPLSKVFNSISRLVSNAWNSVSKTTSKTWGTIEHVISNTVGSVWKFVRDKFNDMRDVIDDAMHAIKKIWDGIWDSIADKVKGAWNSIKGTVISGVNAIGGFWNTGATGLEKVAGFFGAKVSVPKMKRLATGTGGRQGERTLAVVNDEESPVYREAIFRNNGKVEIPEGRNVITRLEPGDAVMPAKQTAKMFGLPHYAKGVGDWIGKAWNYAASKISKLDDMIDDKLDAIEDALKDPLGTLIKIFTRGTNSAKVIWRDIADDGARNKLPHWSEHWFTSLLEKLQDKLESVDSGPLTGDHKKLMRRAGIPASWFDAINFIVTHESGWNPHATNKSSGAYGLPQALPGSKMASAGNDWQSNPVTQLKWMKEYVSSRYGGGPGAAAFWKSHNWYANGGWADRPSIFGEVPGEPEVAINPKRESADDLILQAINSRAKANPNSTAARLSQIITHAKQSANSLVSHVGLQSTNSHFQSTKINDHLNKLNGDVHITMQMDGATLGKIMYPRFRALQNQEAVIRSGNGAVPVGRAIPVGGMY